MTTMRDPVGDLAGFARAIGAIEIAEDAAAISRRLRERYMVISVGGIPGDATRTVADLVVGEGRVIVEGGAGPATMPRRKVDLAIFVVESATDDLRRLVSDSGAEWIAIVLVGGRPPNARLTSVSGDVFGTRSPQVLALLETVHRCASRKGLAGLRSTTAGTVRLLSNRLHRYLDEQEHALAAPREEAMRRISELRCAAGLVAHALETRKDGSDDPSQLARELQRRRQMFLMATKADAIADLTARLGALLAPKRTFRRTAIKLAKDIAEDHVLRWSEELREHASRHIERLDLRLIQELATELDAAMPCEWGIPIYPTVLVRGDVTPQPHVPEPSETWVDLLRREDRIRAAAETECVKVVVDLLRDHSERAVNDWLRFFAESRRALFASLPSSLLATADMAEQTTRWADTIRTTGPRAVTSALAELRRSREQLATLAARISVADSSRTERS